MFKICFGGYKIKKKKWYKIIFDTSVITFLQLHLDEHDIFSLYEILWNILSILNKVGDLVRGHQSDTSL